MPAARPKNGAVAAAAQPTKPTAPATLRACAEPTKAEYAIISAISAPAHEHGVGRSLVAELADNRLGLQEIAVGVRREVVHFTMLSSHRLRGNGATNPLPLGEGDRSRSKRWVRGPQRKRPHPNPLPE